MSKPENTRCRIVFRNKAGEVTNVMDPRTGRDIVPASERRPGGTTAHEPKPDVVPMHPDAEQPSP